MELSDKYFRRSSSRAMVMTLQIHSDLFIPCIFARPSMASTIGSRMRTFTCTSALLITSRRSTNRGRPHSDRMVIPLSRNIERDDHERSAAETRLSGRANGRTENGAHSVSPFAAHPIAVPAAIHSAPSQPAGTSTRNDPYRPVPRRDALRARSNCIDDSARRFLSASISSRLFGAVLGVSDKRAFAQDLNLVLAKKRRAILFPVIDCSPIHLESFRKLFAAPEKINSVLCLHKNVL